MKGWLEDQGKSLELMDEGGVNIHKIEGAVDDIGKVDDVLEGGEVLKGGGGSNPFLSPEIEQKILGGERIPGKNGVRGGHSPNVVNNANPDYAVEILKENADGTLYVQYYTQFPDGTMSKLKKGTLFPNT